jgi:hypothetical protein
MEADEKFPPTLPSKSATVASFIPSRSPEFKVHSSPGLCHSALGYGGFDRDRAKYELADGEWVRVWYFAGNATRECPECKGNPFEIIKARQGDRGYWRSAWREDPRHTGPVWNHTPVCADCNERLTQEIKQAEQDMEYREKHERYFLNN